MALRDVERDGIDRVDLAQARDQWMALVSIEIHFGVS
jgi:hypothetical protein